MTLTDFQAAKLREWAEHVLTNGNKLADMPRGIQEVAHWARSVAHIYTLSKVPPFPTFDTEQPYTWEG